MSTLYCLCVFQVNLHYCSNRCFTYLLMVLVTDFFKKGSFTLSVKLKQDHIIKFLFSFYFPWKVYVTEAIQPFLYTSRFRVFKTKQETGNCLEMGDVKKSKGIFSRDIRIAVLWMGERKIFNLGGTRKELLKH